MRKNVGFLFLAVSAVLRLSYQAEAQSVQTDIVAVVDSPNSSDALRILYLGFQSNTHHNPTAVFNQLNPVFQAKGATLTFTNDLNDINETTLANYDALMMYGNLRSGVTTTMEPLATVIIDYVRNGGSLIGLHVASAAFRFDPRFAELLGGRFQSHRTGQFTPETVALDHPLTFRLPPLDAFDETYIHKDLNPDIIVLQERVKDGSRFPWTWVRTEGPGRVFYTASGHVPLSGLTGTFDAIIQPAFHELVQRGTHWATRRHFSSFSVDGLTKSGKVVGFGELLTPESKSCWTSDPQGPEIFAPDSDTIILDDEIFEFSPHLESRLISCPDPQESLIFSRGIVNELDEQFQGFWKTDPSVVISPLLVEGQTLGLTSPTTIVESLNTEVGSGFVANGSGQILCRAVLKDQTTGLTESVVFLSEQGVVIREGDSHSSLTNGATFGALASGPLSLNSNQQFACLVSTSDGKQAVAFWNGSTLTLPLLEGHAVSGLTNTLWGSVLRLKVNTAGEIGAIVNLTGSINGNTDTALVKISPSGTTRIVLREGQNISGSTQIGDLTQTDFVMDEEASCFLISPLTGPLVTAQNGHALIRVSSSSQIIVREDDALPAISSIAKMGNTLGQTSLSLDPAGYLYFKANKIDGDVNLETLFKVENNTVFEILSEGDQIKRNSGEFFEISTIESHHSGSLDDGLPSQTNISNTIASALTSSSGHQLLVKLSNLDDIDQDGMPNILEAGLGSSPNNPSEEQANLPSLRAYLGQTYFVYLRPTVEGIPTGEVQESADLVSWIPSTTSPIVWYDQSDTPYGLERIGLAVDQTGQTNFYRLAF